MSWTIHVLENTVQVDVAGKDEINALVIAGRGDDGTEGISIKGRLKLCPESMEHIDWIWPDAIINALVKHNASGRVAFLDPEGYQTPKFWGYEFVKGQGCKHLIGKVVWETR